jgi:ATP-dependent Clp protease adapter protein ClpS
VNFKKSKNYYVFVYYDKNHLKEFIITIFKTGRTGVEAKEKKIARPYKKHRLG